MCLTILWDHVLQGQKKFMSLSVGKIKYLEIWEKRKTEKESKSFKLVDVEKTSDGSR